MKMRQALAALVAACACGGFADSLYVDIDNPNAADDTAVGRGSAELPYWSIQSAVEAAEKDGSGYDFAAGDKILVKPGVYTNKYVTTPTCTQRMRVRITKPLRLESTDGAAATAIVGLSSGSTGTRIRGVYVTDTAPGTIVKGFTISGGTQNNSGDRDRGGCVRADAEAYIVDCVLTNGAATYATALYGGTAIRTLITGCSGALTWNGGVVACANLWNCVFDQTKAIDNAHYASFDTTNVNTTVIFHNAAVGLRNIYYNCVFQALGGGSQSGSAYTNTVTASDGTEFLHSPCTGDYRLMPGTAAVGGAKTSHLLSIFNVPAEFRTTSFDGETIDYSAETLNMGALQKVETPSCGAWRSTAVVLNVDGWLVPNGCWFRSASPTNYLHVLPQDGALHARICGQPPLLDGVWHLLPPSNPATVYSIWEAAGSKRYVAEDGDDDTGDGSSANPYRTIYKAVKSLSGVSGDNVVVVGPGTYDTGGEEVDGVYTRIPINAVNGYTWRIVASDGPTNTTIVGRSDGDCRIVSFSGGGAFLQGFTVTGARLSSGDGVIYGVPVYDCIVSNCTASSGALLYNASAVRTRLARNTCGTVLFGGSYVLAFDSVYGNTCGSRLNATPGNPSVYNCTFSGNVTPSGASHLESSYSYLNNCLIDANGCAYQLCERSGLAPNYLWNVGTLSGVASSANYILADGMLADAAGGDHALRTGSPAIGTAAISSLTYSGLSSFYYYAGGDIDGRELAFTADGKISLGCNQHDVKIVTTINAAHGGLAVEGAKIGANAIPEGGSLTFTVRPDSSSRPASGICVTSADGSVETNRFDALPGGAWSHTTSSAATMVTVDAFYDLRDYYVDAEDGDDGNDGLAPARARKTLAGLFTNAVFIAGDVVHAAAGTYAEGAMRDSATAKVLSRVVIPADVSLVSDEGRAVTFIEGANSEVNEGGDGCGTNAVRCAYLNVRSRLEGFTLRKGRTYHTGSGDDVTGGGVCVSSGAGNDARIVDCSITGCYGAGSGVVRGGTLVRCDLSGNSQHGAATCQASGTVFVNCYIGGISSQANLGSCTLYGCVSVPQSGYCNLLYAGTRAYNSLIYGIATKLGEYYNCVFCTNGAAYSPWDKSSIHFDTTNAHDCYFTNTSVGVDASYRPKEGSVLINRGANDRLFDYAGDGRTDRAGAPRVMDYVVDVGAYEYEGTLRADMKASLGKYVASVGWISSNAVVNAESRVLLDRDGATLEATLVSREGQAALSVPATLTGEGTLACSVDGVVKGTLAATGTLSAPGVPYGSTVVFTYTGTGTATLGTLALRRGFVLILK